MPTPTYKTRIIAGQKITLKVGTRYVASRPAAGAYPAAITRAFPVTIKERGTKSAMTIPGLSYEAANDLVNAFNNGKTSFEGRIWK